MASTSTINQWVEDLASSLLPASTSGIDRKSKRLRDNFRRRVRHHNFARTNQFEVRDKLNGLEEKFQVLNRDDLSDALYKRRLELRVCHEQWIPDVLDLLLNLSDNPLRKTKFNDVNTISHPTGIPTVLKWADIEADDPFDRRDPIWQVPVLSDLSSDEDEAISSVASTPPCISRQAHRKDLGPVDEPALVFQNANHEQAQKALQALLISSESSAEPKSEIELVKDTLIMAQGYPSKVFSFHDAHIQLDGHVRLHNTGNQTLRAHFRQVIELRNDLDVVKKWVEHQDLATYLETVQEAICKIVQGYTSSISAIEERILYPESPQVITLLTVVSEIQELGRPLAIVARWVRNASASDPIHDLDCLYELICEYYFTGCSLGIRVLLPIFVNTFEVYLRPILAWLRDGDLESINKPFFVRSHDSIHALNTNLWNNWFELKLAGPHRAPEFLKHVVQDIFSCGKTICFINRIGATKLDPTSEEYSLKGLLKDVRLLVSDPLIPFPAAFSNILQNYFSNMLASRTLNLRSLLDSRCGMKRTLNAFEHIYLRKQGALLDAIEIRIFTRIDKCMDNWNDRFLVSDMLEDLYADVECVDVRSIMVHAAHTSSRSMESRRRSVRILGALALDYALPWPVANIIPKESLAAYRRIALHLTQIRRAKYVLDRCAYFHVHGTPISDNPKDQMVAQTTTFMLIQFTNTLYDHFTTGVSLPLTTTMRKDLSSAATVDAMIAVHKTYITNLETACLTTKQLKMLRETLIGLLDMCIRFSDLVSFTDSASKQRRGSDEFESGSFVSAQSQRRRRRLRSKQEDVHDSSDEDDHDDDFDGEGEGYSSFIVLGEDTSVVQEIKKLRVQFGRQLDFFIAGLRGVGRGGGTVDTFEMLADRLEWKPRSQ